MRAAADAGTEILFQVIAALAVITITTNLPISVWTHAFPNPRLCKAPLDRVTDWAHIIGPARIHSDSAAPRPGGPAPAFRTAVRRPSIPGRQEKSSKWGHAR